MLAPLVMAQQCVQKHRKIPAKIPQEQNENREIPAKIPRDCQVLKLARRGCKKDMAGPSQSDLECMKILLPGMYAEKLIKCLFSMC
jgi:hypothetical protein